MKSDIIICWQNRDIFSAHCGTDRVCLWGSYDRDDDNEGYCAALKAAKAHCYDQMLLNDPVAINHRVLELPRERWDERREVYAVMLGQTQKVAA